MPPALSAPVATLVALLPLTLPEVRRLLVRLVLRPVSTPTQVLAWSVWRRRHQHRAQACHYRRRSATPP